MGETDAVVSVIAVGRRLGVGENSKGLQAAERRAHWRAVQHAPAPTVELCRATRSDLSSVTSPGAPVLPNQKLIANGQVAPGIPSAAPRFTPNFRSADGGGNNPLIPSLGQGGTPCARSVQSKHPLPANTLPDSGELFDSLLRARDFKAHPNGNSSLTFAYASLVTHQLFLTDPRDMTKNNTSSYLNLSILYGHNQDQQDMPAASALLVIFSISHNYIAPTLLSINERECWTNPPPDDPAKRALQDEEIFQTARLVNCGHFMATIFGDYVAGFLGASRDRDSRSMNPFDLSRVYYVLRCYYGTCSKLKFDDTN